MTAPGVKAAYVAELNAIAKRYGDLEDTTIKKMLTALKKLRGRIAAQLTVAQDYKAYHLTQLQAGINEQIQLFQAELGPEIYRAWQDAASLGADEVLRPFAVMGIPVGYASVSSAQLNAALDFSARLIQQIAEDMRQRIDQRIRLAVVGDISPFDTMRAITGELGIEAKALIWAKRPDPVKGVAARAETILRTEMQRVNNLATFSQQQVTAANVPGLTKSWMATGDMRTRASHLQAHTKYRLKPIGINEYYIIGPKQSKLLYPGDPKGPPEETIKCRCRSVTHHPAVGRVGSSLDGRIAAELKRREKESTQIVVPQGRTLGHFTRKWAGVRIRA